jgi:GNAT superfamily N-acetyltransferase
MGSNIGRPKKNKGPERFFSNGFSWTARIAHAKDLPLILEHLCGHMAPKQKRQFGDKLSRYIRKPDRDVLLAAIPEQVLGITLIIEQADIPDTWTPETTAAVDIIDWKVRLDSYSCSTNLLVHPAFRKRGIGSSLIKQWRPWSIQRNRWGIWFDTHRLAGWYITRFDFEHVGQIMVKGVEKSVMAKNFHEK